MTRAAIPKKEEEESWEKQKKKKRKRDLTESNVENQRLDNQHSLLQGI